MRRSIGRPARALLPLVLGALVFAGDGVRAAAFTVALLTARLFSLGAGAAFQAAGGRVVREDRLRGNFLMALILAILGGAAAAWVLGRGWIPALGLPEVSAWMALSGAMVMISEVFSNRLYALTDKLSAPFCDALTAALVAAGLASSRGDDRILFFFALAALFVSLIAGLGIGGMANLRPGARVLAEIPRELLRAWLPAALLASFLMLGRSEPLGAFSAAGWALFSWAYVPNRRSEEESGPVTVLTTLVASAAAITVLLRPALWGINSMMLALPVYFACILTVYIAATPGARAEIALLFYTLAVAAAGWRISGAYFFGVAYVLPYVVGVSAAAAVALVLPDVFTAMRLARARSRARRRQGKERG